MTDPLRDRKPATRWIWTIALILLAIGATFWFAKPLAEPEKVESAEPVAQSTERAEEPEGYAVPVTLPETPLRNVPVEAQDEGAEGRE